MAGIATEDQQRSPKDCSTAAVLTLFPRPAVHTPLSDRMSNPTAEDIVKVAQSGNTGEVKTLTDIKLEAFEKRLTEMEKINAELRAANAELYAYASSFSQPQTQAQPAAQPQASAQPVAAAAVQPAQDQATVEAARQREEENLNSVLVTMGYKKAQNTTTPPNDGM